MTGVTVDIGSPRSLVTFVTVDNRLPYVFVPIILLQHSYCTFVIILSGPFTWLFINLTMCVRALFPKSARSCRTRILAGATFSQNEKVQVPLR